MHEISSRVYVYLTTSLYQNANFVWSAAWLF